LSYAATRRSRPDGQRRTELLLESKNAVIYGAGGGIGVAREGARVYLAGRTRASLEAVAADITAAGGSAEAATETFMRYLAAEVGPHGVRVVGLWTAAGVPETLSREKLASVGGEGAPDPETLERMLAEMTMLRRAPRLAQVADVAAFLASDRAGAITATITNVTCGLVPG
jgi:enoyl-[acyl-carrier-protein] reductase (NADH)